MSYSFVSPLGSTPEERLKKGMEAITRKSVLKTQEEATAFIQALKASGQPIIFHRVEENDVFSYNVSAKGDKELSATQIADLKSRYDFANLTQDAYKALLAELNRMGVLRHGQARYVADMNETGGTISQEDISTCLHGQVGGAKKLLDLLRAHPDPSLLAIDGVEKAIASFEKLDKIMKKLFDLQPAT